MRALKARLVKSICVLFLFPWTAMASAQGISAAERLLFDTNHMQGIQAPTILTYSYQKEAAGEDGFKDEVKVDITRINPDATVAVTTQFLSGDRNVPLPAIEGAHGNPAVLGFLERDIVEMKRLTGGSTGYFRKRIRMALANTQEIKPIRVSYAGKDFEGKEVRIQPYLNDPMRERFPKFENKAYVFIFCQDLPGSLYRIRSSSMQDQSGVVETLTLMSADRKPRQ